MKLPINCPQCGIHDSAISLMSVEFTDDGRYEVECLNGHRFLTALQHYKFEVLFEIGVYAIRDGYYREAVSSFTASLERFYEFFVRAALIENGLGVETITTSWREVAKQSERQLGAFIFVYTREFGRTPKLLANSRVQFRNKVIHEGTIPTRQQAVDYGQAVLDIMRPILREAQERFAKGAIDMIRRHVYEKGDTPSMVIVTGMIVSWFFKKLDQEEPSLNEYLDRLVKRPPEDAP